MTDSMITKTEARQRLRYVRGGDWDDALIDWDMSGYHHVTRTTVVPPASEDPRYTLLRLERSGGLPDEFVRVHEVRSVRR